MFRGSYVIHEFLSLLLLYFLDVLFGRCVRWECRLNSVIGPSGTSRPTPDLLSRLKEVPFRSQIKLDHGTRTSPTGIRRVGVLKIWILTGTEKKEWPLFHPTPPSKINFFSSLSLMGPRTTIVCTKSWDGPWVLRTRKLPWSVTSEENSAPSRVRTTRTSDHVDESELRSKRRTDRTQMCSGQICGCPLPRKPFETRKVWSPGILDGLDEGL